MDKKTFRNFIDCNIGLMLSIKQSAYSLHDIDVNQKYDDKPYSYHLRSVYNCAKEYAHLVIDNENDIIPVLFGALYHDSIEDARLTYNDVMKIAKKYMNDEQAYLATEIVYALTNEKGRNRDERANYRYYEINEGLIKNLFGRVKNMFGGWKKINGNEEIKRVYSELDDKLTGFSSIKYSKYNQCQEIRKQLVEFAEVWYEHKLDQAEDGKNPLPAKGMKFKDETMKQNFEKCEKRIKEIAAGDTMIEKWAECLLDDMKLVINKSIINNLKGEDDIEKQKYEEQIKKQEEELKKQEDLNKKMEKIQQDSLKKIQETRNKLISDAGATPMNDKFLGDKAIQNLCGEYEKVKDDFKKDSQLGLKNLFDKKEVKNPLAKEAIKVIAGFYEQLEKDMDKFTETPGSSVQSMCIASEYAIKHALFGGNDYPNSLELMSRCAITSDITVGYGLPFTDDKKEMNYFTNFVSNSLSDLIKSKADEEAIKDSKYDANIKTLMSKIVDEAKKIKENEEKQYKDNIEKVKKQFSK